MPEQMPPNRRLVQSAVILDMLDISRSTLDRLIDDDGFPVVTLSNKLRRFDLDAVNAWLDARQSGVDSRWSTRTPDEADAA